MKIFRNIAYAAFFMAFALGTQTAMGQDTSRKKTIDITSTFKPVLREAVKLNFSAALPTFDTIRPVLAYSIPQQQVNLPFQPGSLRPVALQSDSLLPWNNSHYLKVGIGNIHIPYIQGALSGGNGTTSFLNAYGEFYAAKGKLPYQKNNLADIQLRGTFKLGPDHELSGKVGFKGEDYFLYGYKPDTLDFSKDQLKQRFETVDGFFSFRNTNPSEYGFSYTPNLKISTFSGKNDDRNAREENFVFNLPMQKTFGKMFGFNLGFTADVTRFNPYDKATVKNTLLLLTPSLLLKTPNAFIQTGIIPSWDNKEFKMLPNILAEMTTNDQRFTLQAGWIGYYDKASYQRFAGINPWLAEPSQLLNQRNREVYVGFKGSLANHFTYSAKAAYFKQHNANLFVNDTIDGKTFETVYSPNLEILQLHGELGYMLGEELSFKGGITYNNFTKIDGQTRAWGLLPFELNGSLRWKILKDLSFTADLYVWDGAAYRTKAGEARKGDGAFDLNAGLQFKVTKSLDLWFQMNNIFNSKYERWNQYQVYGINVLGGVVFRFNQK
ncbi:TonB-dependent receptor [Flavihumibacter profundi]|uniref:hypothetical protein n=1 Tax=Flavihumibacter profundi TaxID=2716883 RepID=UPI001CC7F1B4|nr:hypothetical protein [Flavihumibacter profundi]MBZ5855727.1 hypothetical protein [Flavihumibacter profundi]